MRSDPYVSPQAPNFYNLRRQASIDWLLSIKVNPFQKFKNPETGLDEDFYLHIMRTMPKLLAETDWELASFRSHSADLTARISAARNRH